MHFDEKLNAITYRKFNPPFVKPRKIKPQTFDSEKIIDIMATSNFLQSITLLICSFVLISCSGTPAGVTPVQNFEAQRYLGQWYEIARLDHSFERDMQSVTANYSMNKDGSIKVLNRGFNTKDKEWSEAKGKAKFVNAQDVGHLKVSFFGPFYGSYIVAELADDYSYSLVTGPNTDYLWILSRTPTLDEAIYSSLIQKAERLGFDTQGLIRVGHSVP